MAGFNYPCLECCLEYLEANKRFHLIGRCPSLQKLDRRVPLRVDVLSIKKEEITLNNIKFKLDELHFQTFRPGLSLMQMENLSTRSRVPHPILQNPLDPNQLDAKGIMKKFIFHFFEGRKEISVGSFTVLQSLEQFVPEGFKVTIRNLTVDRFSFKSAVKHFSNPLPLQNLVLEDWPQFLNRIPFEFVKNAKYIEMKKFFRSDDYRDFKSFSQLSNEEIQNHSFAYFIAAPILYRWKVESKDVGYKYTQDFGGYNLTRLSEIIEMMLTNGNMNENFGRERVYTAKHICIPLTRTSDIVVNYFERWERPKIEMMTVEHIPGVVQNKV